MNTYAIINGVVIKANKYAKIKAKKIIDADYDRIINKVFDTSDTTKYIKVIK